MGWVLSMAGYKITLLKGGYKSFRHYVLQQFTVPMQMQVIGGHTGSGKTELLGELEKMGEQIIDLERYANHKGSAFGSLGLPDQPSNEQFENLLGVRLRQIDYRRPVWIEAESRSIGRVKIPDEFFRQMQVSPLIELEASRAYRAKRIAGEYGTFPEEMLKACTEKLKKKLGGLLLHEALQALEENNFDRWLEILMDYYDKTYAHSLNERSPSERERLEVADHESTVEIAARLIAHSFNKSPQHLA